jgi:hypothetical protein
MTSMSFSLTVPAAKSRAGTRPVHAGEVVTIESESSSGREPPLSRLRSLTSREGDHVK